MTFIYISGNCYCLSNFLGHGLRIFVFSYSGCFNYFLYLTQNVFYCLIHYVHSNSQESWTDHDNYRDFSTRYGGCARPSIYRHALTISFLPLSQSLPPVARLSLPAYNSNPQPVSLPHSTSFILPPNTWSATPWWNNDLFGQHPKPQTGISFRPPLFHPFYLSRYQHSSFCPTCSDSMFLTLVSTSQHQLHAWGLTPTVQIQNTLVLWFRRG